jgi:hypothetical protein
MLSSMTKVLLVTFGGLVLLSFMKTFGVVPPLLEQEALEAFASCGFYMKRGICVSESPESSYFCGTGSSSLELSHNGGGSSPSFARGGGILLAVSA